MLGNKEFTAETQRTQREDGFSFKKAKKKKIGNGSIFGHMDINN